MRRVNIVQWLYVDSDKSSCNGSVPLLEQRFPTTVGPLSPVLFNIDLEIIRRDEPHEHHTSAPIGGRPPSSPRIADDSCGSNSELQAATYKLASTPYKVQSSLGKSKVMKSTIR